MDFMPRFPQFVRFSGHPVPPTRGSALVIVLAFVVLMTGISFAIFTRAMSERKISNSSANQTKVSLFADGAVATIIGDLNAEIVEKSTDLTPSGSKNKLYFPKTAQDMVPERVNIPDSLQNLVKRSASGEKFFAGSTASRASKESTITPSQNGRYVTLARWNSHFLLPKETTASDTDAKPIPAFTPPDWILVDKKGGNPEQGNTDVIGRFAYAIYDEGGLLDLNAAGYPSALATATAPNGNATQRGSLAFADLKQLTESPDGSGPGLLTDAQIDAIVGRRNFVSASIDNETESETTLGGTFPNFTFSAKNAENYRRFGHFNSGNFLTTPRKNTLSGDTSASDRMFLTRQEMISFLMEGVSTTPDERAKLQTALQYLTQFSRDLNQPSIAPMWGGAFTPPRIGSGHGSNGDVYDNGNQATSVNPDFLQVRRQSATTAATSTDGTIAEAGEPVVKKRFPLNRLAWVTFNGPIANESGQLSSDAAIQELIKQYKKEGLTEEFLKQGTAANIKRAFGLTWGTATINGTSVSNVWIYREGVTSSNADPSIRSLNTVAATNEEPNFFELLRAAVTVGAVTRSGSASTVSGSDPLGPLFYQYKRDISTQLAIIQLGANIMDQFDPDGYPMLISFDDGVDGSGAKLVAGVEDLPYIYRVRAGAVMFANSDPPLSSTRVPPSGNTNPPPSRPPMFEYKPSGQVLEAGGVADNSIVDNSSPYPDGELRRPGIAACLMIPEIWNPNNPKTANAPVSSALFPANFRIVADSVNPSDIGRGTYYAFNMVGWKNNGQNWSDAAAGSPATGLSFGYTGNWNRRLNDSNSVITFSAPIDPSTNSSGLFRDPTILFMANKPEGSNLGVDQAKMKLDGNLAPYILQDSSGDGYGFMNAGPISNLPTSAANPIGMPVSMNSNTRIVGFPIGLIPLRWTGPRIAKFPDRSKVNNSLHSSRWFANIPAGGVHPAPIMLNGAANMTLRLQYQRGSDWVTYDTKYVDARVQVLGVPQGDQKWGPIVGYTSWSGFVDPRTGKFGAFYPNSFSASNTIYAPPANNYQSEWLDPEKGTVVSDLSSTTPSAARPNILVTAADWNSYAFPTSQFRVQTNIAKGQFVQNIKGVANYYHDADGVIRPAMGAKAEGTLGLPSAPLIDAEDSRPVALNRPFHTVGELGYVFSGMPWRNIDFTSVQSGYSSLLDLFCINETPDPSGLVAGKVNLNTRQIPVLKAIIAGAYKNAVSPAPALTDTDKVVDSTLATDIATWLTTRTESNPLRNVGDLVGRYISGDGNGDDDFDGFSKDLFGNAVTSGSGKLKDKDGKISGFGESAIRSLAGVGTTRVWNLMIDLVAQTGKYPPGNAKFVVEGEQRYWVHVAIDRFTGKVLDMNTEIVKE